MFWQLDSVSFVGVDSGKINPKVSLKNKVPAVVLNGPQEGFLFRVKVPRGGGLRLFLKIRTALTVRSLVQ